MPDLKLTKRGQLWHIAGTIDGKRIRKSTGTGDRRQAEAIRAEYEARLRKRSLYGDEAIRTFEEAALSYLQQGGEGRYLPPLLAHFKGRALATIKPGEIREAALLIYPNDKASTRNRQAITPARAVINHGHDMGWCHPIRVKLFPTAKPTKNKPVTREWLDAFMAQADRDSLPHLSAAVLFMNQTGARVSEAVGLLGDHVDLERRIAVLAATKTDEWVTKHLTAELTLRIAALGLEAGMPVFRYTDRAAVNRRMVSVCQRAGIPHHSPHAAGRHSFATTAMKMDGARAKQVMVAGGWKSAALFMETYVHDEDAGRDLARKLDAQTGMTGTNMAHDQAPKKYRFGKKGK